MTENLKFAVYPMVLGVVSTNCYIVANQVTKEAVIVDPADSAIRIQNRIEELGLTPVALLVTHGHFDHIMAIPQLTEKYHIPTYIYEVDKPLMADPMLNCSALFMPRHSMSITEAQTVTDDQQLSLAGMDITVIHTPGHTAGGCCYYFEDCGFVMTGDTLFCGTVGRCDLPTGNYQTLLRSIKSRLFILPEETKVYPGHEQSTTIGQEIVHNMEIE